MPVSHGFRHQHWARGPQPRPARWPWPLWERPAPPPAHSRGYPGPIPNPELPPAGPRPELTEARESCVAVASVGAAEGSLFFPNLFLADGDSLQRRPSAAQAGGGTWAARRLAGSKDFCGPGQNARSLWEGLPRSQQAKQGEQDVNTRIPPTVAGSERPGCTGCPSYYTKSSRTQPHTSEPGDAGDQD